MQRFTIHVELHDADVQTDYPVLNAAMKKAGFRATIIDLDGIEYHLPTAEYSYVGTETLSEVHDKAATAARMTNKNFAILVTAGGTLFSGLAAVQNSR